MNALFTSMDIHQVEFWCEIVSVLQSAGNVWQNAPQAAVLKSVVFWLLRSPCPSSLYTAAVEKRFVARPPPHTHNPCSIIRTLVQISHFCLPNFGMIELCFD